MLQGENRTQIIKINQFRRGWISFQLYWTFVTHDVSVLLWSMQSEPRNCLFTMFLVD
jgi:hypothetical protein